MKGTIIDYKKVDEETHIYPHIYYVRTDERDYALERSVPLWDVGDEIESKHPGDPWILVKRSSLDTHERRIEE